MPPKKKKRQGEAERRSVVAQEKAWGARIEALERTRMHPVASSIAKRLLSFYDKAQPFLNGVKEMSLALAKRSANTINDPVVPITTNQTNVLVRTYNSIVKDLHLHLGKRDSYVTTFCALDELDEPTYGDVLSTLYTLVVNATQILAYLRRWTE